MSATTIRTIYDEADRRLAAAVPGEETLAIGLDFFKASGIALAESLYTRVAAESFSNLEVNVAITETLDELLNGIIESFKAHGFLDKVYLRRCLETASRGFLERGETLFSLDTAGGRA